MKNLLSKKDYSRKNKILIILEKQSEPIAVKDIKAIGISNGLRDIKNWNISKILGSLEDKVIRLEKGWEITDEGKNSLIELGISKVKPTKVFETDLENYLKKIKDINTKNFLKEVIQSLKFGLFRSAVVLSWVGALYLLYDEVIKKHLHEFNIEAVKRNRNWKPAKNIDDLTLMKEYDFLQIICKISIIGKNLKQELENCLKLRNACGHPNTLSLGANRVAAHIEILILNIFNRYAN